jgi:D-serine deaminase-like pyridoxal phosphate-dependent protein
VDARSRAANPIEALRHRPIAATEKGFGCFGAGQMVTAATLAERRPPALGSAFTMPLLVLRESALAHNIAVMADWCANAGVRLAPHGKTTMAPQLFARQLAAGAWGITAATISQVQVYRAFGIGKILIANELTDRAGIGWLAAEMTADLDWECYAYADSVVGVELVDHALHEGGARRPLPVLIELGFPGGRTGCRTTAEALEVAAAVWRSRWLRLAGAAGFEGGIGTTASEATLDAVAAYCRRLRALCDALAGSVVSAGGSAYFDVVARELTAPPQAPTAPQPQEPATPPRVILRSGCYLTHDHGMYATDGPDSRHSGPGLIPAMELWAPVLSRPEPGLAIACAGRRDASIDQRLPIPLRTRRPDGAERSAGQLRVTQMADQHAYISVPRDFELAPGDLVCLGISHPCTTFDKWRVIPVVDDDYRVIDAVHTFF